MKKIIGFLPLVLVAITMFSCKKVLEIKENLFPAIDINLPQFQVVMPPVPVVPANEITLGTLSARFNLDSAIKVNTGGVFGVSAISSIRVKQMTLTVVNPDQQNNLANFETARLSIYSGSNTTSTEIANFIFPDIYAVSASSTPVSAPDIKSYFNNNELNYILAGKNRKVIGKSLTMTINTTVSVK